MMKTLQHLTAPKLLMVFLCAVLSLSACQSEDEDPTDSDPCEEFECLNGGTAMRDVELDNCRCQCPTGYSGAKCETFSNPCPGAECPIGKKPNPNNGCACE